MRCTTHTAKHTEETLDVDVKVEFAVELLLMSQHEAKVQMYCAKRFCEQKIIIYLMTMPNMTQDTVKPVP